MKTKLARWLNNVAYLLRQEHKLAYLMEQLALKLDKSTVPLDDVSIRGRYDR